MNTEKHRIRAGEHFRLDVMSGAAEVLVKWDKGGGSGSTSAPEPFPEDASTSDRLFWLEHNQDNYLGHARDMQKRLSKLERQQTSNWTYDETLFVALALVIAFLAGAWVF